MSKVSVFLLRIELAYKGSIAGVSSISETEIDAYISGTTTDKRTSSTRLMVGKQHQGS